MQIDAFTGDKYYQAVSWQDGKMVPAGWKRYAHGNQGTAATLLLFCEKEVVRDMLWHD